MASPTSLDLAAMRFSGFLVTGAMLICLLGSGPAAASAARTVSVGAPEGFAELSAEQAGIVDIYYGGRLVGEARIRTEKGRIKFAEPAQIVPLLPALKDPEAARRILASGELGGNANLACSPHRDASLCGRLSPPALGIIHDKNNQRIDIFIAEALLAAPAEEIRYLPSPGSGVSALNTVAGLVSGSSDGGTAFTVQNRLLLAERNRRLRADLSYSDRIGVSADEIVFEIDRPEFRYSAGAFWVNSSAIIGRKKVLGAGVQTQLDTRIDREAAFGTPLIVFLDQRSKVSIVRDGRLIYSRMYEAGSQRLETSSLADGSYEVVLQIEPLSGGVRQERRFFSKNRALPSMGQPALSAYAGLLVDNSGDNFLEVTGTPFAQASIGIRKAKSIALEATLFATDEIGAFEAGAYLLTSSATLKLSGIGSTDGSYGAMLQVHSEGDSRFNYIFDLRHVNVSGHRNILQQDQNFGPARDPDGALLPSGTIWQASGTAGLSLHAAQLLGSASYRRDAAGQSNYSFGPSVRWDFYQHERFRLTLNGDMSFTDRGESGFLGVSLHMLGDRTSLSSSAGIRRSALGHKETKTGVVSSLYGAWQNAGEDGRDIRLSAGYDRDLDQSAVSAAANVRSAAIQLTGDISHGEFSGRNVTQYSAGFGTTVSANADAIELDSRSRSDSVLIVRIDGAGPNDSFDVLVNGAEVGRVSDERAFSLALPTYNRYSVRIRPNAGGLVYYDGSSKEISVFPGSVVSLQWEIKPLKVVFGRLVSPAGVPVLNASLVAEGGIGQTDEHGYFQIETVSGSDLEVLLADGRPFKITLPPGDIGSRLQKVGDLACCTGTNQTSLALLADQ